MRVANRLGQRVDFFERDDYFAAAPVLQVPGARVLAFAEADDSFDRARERSEANGPSVVGDREA